MSGTVDPIIAPNNPPLTASPVPGYTLTPTGGAGAGGVPTSPANPNTGGIDASKMMLPLSTLQGALATSASDVAASRNSGFSGQAAVAAGAGGVAAGTQGINAADYMSLLQRQQNDAEVYARFGTTPGAPSKVVSDLSARVFSDEADISSRRDALQQKLDARFLDNPIQWFLNQVTIPFDQEAMQNKISGRNDDLEVLHKLAIATQEGTAQDASAAYTVSTAKLAGMAQVAIGQATQVAGEANLRLAGALVGTADAGDRIASTEYTGAAQNLSLNKDVTVADYNMTLQAQANARAAEQHIVQMNIENLQNIDLNKKMAATNDLDNRVKKIAAITGATDAGGALLQNYAQLGMMAEGKQKQAILDLLWNPDIQQGSALSLIGPSQAIDFANNLHLPLQAGADLTRQQLTQMQSAYITSLGPTAKSLYTPEQIAINTNKYIKDKLTTDAHNIPSIGSMYSPPSLLTTLNLPGVSGTPLADALAPLANPAVNRDKNYPTDARDIVAAATTLIQNGKATPADMAAQVANIYTAIGNSNQLSRGYRIFGIPTPASTGSFNAAVPAQGTFGATEVHNLANKIEMETYFTRGAIQRSVNPPGLTGVP